MRLNFTLSGTSLTILFALTGILLGLTDSGCCTDIATNITLVFMRLLKMLSMPLIFFSVVAALSKLSQTQEGAYLGRRLALYTFGTTLCAAGGAAFFYKLFLAAPQQAAPAMFTQDNPLPPIQPKSYDFSKFLLDAIPDSFLGPFLSNNILSVLFLAAFVVIALRSVPTQSQQALARGFEVIYDLILNMTGKITPFVSIVVGAFTYLFTRDIIVGQADWSPFFYYTLAILAANFFQGLIILPIMVRTHGASPWQLARAVYPALVFAFFSKSSSATLPLTMQVAEQRAHINKHICQFTLPLCSTVNMNACAAFILISVLHTLALHGQAITYSEIFIWVIIATIASIGNAAVPMGCYFLACSFLAAQDIPLDFMGAILPIYGLLDMVETAINVWSDTCITRCMDQRQSESPA